MAVEEADAHERHAEVAGRLEVVAGQHAEAAGVLRQRLGDAELGGEVGDRAQGRPLPGLEPAVAVEVALELVPDLARGTRMKPASSTSASSRSRGTRPSSRTGSWTVASHASGSTQRNRSRVWASQDQRRFMASSSSAASSAGRDGRTVKLRRAFISSRPYRPLRTRGTGERPAETRRSRPVRCAGRRDPRGFEAWRSRCVRWWRGR